MLQVSIWHKKKPDIDELESIAKLKLAEASSLKLTKHNGRLRCCKECTTEMDKFEEECASNYLKQRLTKLRQRSSVCFRMLS